MSTLTQSQLKIKTKFQRNCGAARQAGYNLRFSMANVYVNGTPVEREVFERADRHALLSLLACWFGRPRGQEAAHA